MEQEVKGDEMRLTSGQLRQIIREELTRNLNESEQPAFKVGDIIQYRPLDHPEDGPFSAVVDDAEYKPGHWRGRQVALRNGRWHLTQVDRQGRPTSDAGVYSSHELVVYPDNDDFKKEFADNNSLERLFSKR